MNTILINRNELEGRRNYTLAHECFHLLTWEQMPPEYTDSASSGNNRSKRVEQLANIFSSTLLMPEDTLSAYWEGYENKDIHKNRVLIKQYVIVMHRTELFGQPGRSFYVTELIELANVGRGAVQRELARLEQSGLVVTERYGNRKHYQANADAPIYKELCSIILKTVGLQEQVRAAL